MICYFFLLERTRGAHRTADRIPYSSTYIYRIILYVYDYTVHTRLPAA